VWTMPKRRREAGDFPGGARIQTELAYGPGRVRVGIQPEGRRPVRDGAELRPGTGSAGAAGPCGTVTSGGFGPTVDRPVAMGYVTTEMATDGTELIADVRGKDVACTVAPLPFVPHRFKRGA